jgi:riboflavin synthase
MFTGIVQGRGTVRRADRRGGGLRLVVAPGFPFPSPVLGESVAVDGVCLTVASFEGSDGLRFDLVPETLARSTLGDLDVGSRVNLERALRLGDPLGGHLVQGHVEGVGRIARVERRGDEVVLEVALPANLAGSVLPKGSVALDGVSLTVGEVRAEGEGESFLVHLVPHTLAVTGLAEKRVGSRVNLEPDLLGRWVEHHLRRVLAKETP